MDCIYLDNNATTRVAPEVAEAMQPYLMELYGNPSSLHAFGQAAQHAIEQARAQVARLIHAQSREIVFTSGGTEADNLAILGTLAAYPTKRHLVTTAVEHSAVINTAERLEKQGYRVTYVGVNRLGRLDLDGFAAALTDDTAIASVMHANNETGALFPIERVAEIAASRGVPLHVDAVQTAGKLPIDVRRTPISLLSISAHKIHGPKGVGALYVRKGTRLRSMTIGGHQERDIRPGTENVHGERAGDRGPRGGGRADAHGAGRDARARPRASGPAGAWHPRAVRLCARQRRSGEPGVQHDEHRVRVAGGGGDPDRAERGGHLRQQRLGVQQRLAGAVARAQGDGN